MNISNLSPEQEKTRITNAPCPLSPEGTLSFPYNHPELLAQYRGHNIVVVDDQIVAAGDIDYRPIFKHYRALGKEPIIICVPAN